MRNSDTHSSEDVEELIDQLWQLRYDFERVDDDYRECRVDVAIEQVEECLDLVRQYEEADMWPDP